MSNTKRIGFRQLIVNNIKNEEFADKTLFVIIIMGNVNFKIATFSLENILFSNNNQSNSSNYNIL